MSKELTLLERREIARKTVPMGLDGWTKIIKGSHRKETYDYFDIPLFKIEMSKYFGAHPIFASYKEHFKKTWNKISPNERLIIVNNQINTSLPFQYMSFDL